MCKIILVTIRNILLALIITLTSLFLTLLASPIYLLRKCIFYIAPLVRPDLAKMLSTRSSAFAIDDTFNKPHFNGIVAWVLPTNNFPLEKIRQEFSSKILLAKNEQEKLIYPELQQTLTTWLGFSFWKPDKSFNLNDHIRLHPRSIEGTITMDKSDNTKLFKKILNTPVPKGKCLWEIQVLWNYQSRNSDQLKTMAIFKFHHALADAFSVLKLMSKGSDQNDLSTMAKPAQIRRSFCYKFLTSIFFFIKVPYDLAKFMFLYDNNDWHKTENAKHKGSLLGAYSDQIPLKDIKYICKSQQVCFSAVIGAVFTAAIRDTMAQQRVKVPERVHCMAPFPYPNHPDHALRNHMCVQTKLALPN